MGAQRSIPGTLAATAVWILVAVSTAVAQEEPVPYADFLLSGYGTTNFSAITNEDVSRSDFTVSLNPVVLYSLGEDVLFETEFEIELEDGQTELGLEYAQIDFLAFDRVQFAVGKFLLPFGVFGERLHATWINKLPSLPLVYGHAHGGIAEGALLPILSDVGAMFRFSQPFSGPWTFDLSLYVTQGPAEATAEDGETDDHVHSVLSPIGSGALASVSANGAALANGFAIPGVAFGSNFSDNNDNKLLGGRAGLVRGGNFELYVSGFHAMYNEGDYLDIYGTNVAAEWRSGSLELRGEGALVWQEFEQVDGSFPTVRTPAYYLQASYRTGDFEPVVRWSHLAEAEVSGEIAGERRRQVAFGVVYWLEPSVPVKGAYEVNLDGNERLLLQWAYGF